MKRRPRRDAVSPRSASWTLYKPQDVADRLDITEEEAHKVLEETGFNKAVRIREALIRWKTSLLIEQREITKAKDRHLAVVADLNKKEDRIKHSLAGIRDILRIPREAIDV